MSAKAGPNEETELPEMAYGHWPSPLSAHDVAQASTRIGGLAVTSHSVFWGERRPTEGGRTAIVEHTGDGTLVDRLPPPWNARSRAHEYGGGAFTALGRTLFFSNFADGRIYRQDAGAAPQPLTPKHEGEQPLAFADLLVDPTHQRLLAVREAHREGAEPTAALVAIELRAGATAGRTLGSPRELASGADFYSSPALSPDGRLMAWLTWSHPRMPWDGTELWIAEVDAEGSLGPHRRIAGGAEESIFQPGFDAAGNLIFVSDRSNWWNLQLIERADLAAATDTDGGESEGRISSRPLAPMQAEFGRPQWIFGMTTWAASSPGHLAAAGTRDGLWTLYGVSTRACEGSNPGESSAESHRALTLPYTAIEEVHSCGDGRVVLIASSPTRADEVVELKLGTQPASVTSRRALNEVATLALQPAEISPGEPIRFASTDGREAHAFFYPPRSTTSRGPAGTQPPLIVKSHGGPTAATNNSFDPAIQFWTTRGFAVVDVNYGGSTGYGRAYRQLLQGRWGIVDVEDCVAAAEWLSKGAKVDRTRRAIRGGSAGGYTTLAALTFTDAFQAGASHYGIGDLEALARDTHKFESRYLDGLIGPYPQRADLYRQRSPIHAVDRMRCPVIFFQGLDDKVVPPNQSEAMAAALRAKGLTTRLVTFAGEGHGFRRAENIARALQEELAFYREVLRL